MKLIKLTEANSKAAALVLNTAFIGSIQKGNTGTDTHIKMSYLRVDREGKLYNEYYFVKECFDEVWRMINE